MSEFWIYLQIGFKHVLDLKGYDHMLFLAALMVPYTFKDWKKILLLISVFTLGHTIALMLSVYKVLTIKTEIVEFLIPVTILITALYSLFTAGKANKLDSAGATVLITAFFGIIHGHGFANYFNDILAGEPDDKLLPLLEFALGIECAQVVVVLIVLILAYIAQTFFRFSKRDWALVMSAFVAGVVLPMIIGNEIWS
jgi:hypothetical protein